MLAQSEQGETMTREEIIKMAKQVGIDIGMWEKLSDNDDVFGYGIDGTHENLEAFAKLVAEKEREACIAHAMISAEKAIDVAIKIEREECAKEAERTFYSVQAAENIRARGDKHD